MAITLDSKILLDGLARFEKAINVEPREAITQLAATVKSLDQNNLTEELLEACKNFESNFNSAMDGAEAAQKDMYEMVDVSEYIEKRATIGEVKKDDLSFAGQNIDASQAMI